MIGSTEYLNWIVDCWLTFVGTREVLVQGFYLIPVVCD